jgi:hypothetical protein
VHKKKIIFLLLVLLSLSLIEHLSKVIIHFHIQQEWMKEDPKNRKLCPKCDAPIKKNGGCHHMFCEKCKTPICWLCLEERKLPNLEHIDTNFSKRLFLTVVVTLLDLFIDPCIPVINIQFGEFLLPRRFPQAAIPTGTCKRFARETREVNLRNRSTRPPTARLPTGRPKPTRHDKWTQRQLNQIPNGPKDSSTKRQLD